MASSHLNRGRIRLSSAGDIRVGDIQCHRLLFIGRGVLIPQQEQVGADPGAESRQFQIPVEPPARILLAEQDHQRGGDGQPGADPGRAGRGILNRRRNPTSGRCRTGWARCARSAGSRRSESVWPGPGARAPCPGSWSPRYRMFWSGGGAVRRKMWYATLRRGTLPV